jgi:hypothetical protein
MHVSSGVSYAALSTAIFVAILALIVIAYGAVAIGVLVLAVDALAVVVKAGPRLHITQRNHSRL